ncbi:hypothetical protein [Loigolactobacillus bifermentans]|uniref:hypothetical protein n=1 Tax=Loigolactobacillus bifermentans TaxID=1607 RepID=UPI001F32E869|nr:hypothetical protein [Loigolactobacillus bifermentans]
MNNSGLIWLGKTYLLSKFTVLLLSISFYFMNYQVICWNFTAAYGLASKMKIIPILESIMNIGVSLVFLKVFHFGINGVILGTIFSTILTVGWQTPFIIFKYGFKQKFLDFFIVYIKDVCSMIIVFGIGWQLSSLFLNRVHAVTTLFINGVLALLIGGIIPVIFYCKSAVFKSLVHRLTNN